MKTWGFLFLTLFCLSACKSGRTSHLDTSDVIAFDKMADVLVDIYKTEEFLKKRQVATAKDTAYIDSLYTAVFNKHGISKKQFRNSYNYYLFMVDEQNVVEEAYNRSIPKPQQQ